MPQENNMTKLEKILNFAAGILGGLTIIAMIAMFIAMVAGA
jgi:hypothetical protein